ncbi:hypothetical protein AX774_g7024 [Zancudomyces culisetae]|uniref:COX assembly mitochondrial protein n=1 Tax=Zancudomyces culisetae TaxID=1213189 RepID=A0A1R1PF56_ZANCU|nr:hypothetical protein AX774_g7024 [Zancudomyces culisetae]|eukprot:OMH79559.1 hypothetical protein AX774_g7024 [Zancudomyces culisetae]
MESNVNSNLNQQPNQEVRDDNKASQQLNGSKQLGHSVLSRRQDQQVRALQVKEMMKLCDEYVKEFVECSRDRTISIVWACKDKKKQMMDCLRKVETLDNLDKVKFRYLENRENPKE